MTCRTNPYLQTRATRGSYTEPWECSVGIPFRQLPWRSKLLTLLNAPNGRYRKDKNIIAPVIALHCSGKDSRQWHWVRDWLAPKVIVHAPDLFGTSARGHWVGRKAFSLEDEAAAIVSGISGLNQPVHIVGHSYGGALGLHIARKRPELVRSLCLYEPTCFSLLKTGETKDKRLLDEIETLSRDISVAVSEECHEYAAQLFTEFWGGIGSWQTLSRERRRELSIWVPKAYLDFRALIDEPSGAFLPSLPTTLMVGAETHGQTKRITEILQCELSRAKVVEIPGADHLGPFRFREAVVGVIWRHLQNS